MPTEAHLPTELIDLKARARSHGRRPIEPQEIAPLEALGALLVSLQRDAHMSTSELATAATISQRHLNRLRQGVVRTRATTLQRIAAALGPLLGIDPKELHGQLVKTAGCALAPPSEFQDRVDRRRQRRLDREAAREATRQKRIAAWRARFGDLGAKPARQRRSTAAGKN
jgi:transcriptional regulator with XRE-family HTH domain